MPSLSTVSTVMAKLPRSLRNLPSESAAKPSSETLQCTARSCKRSRPVGSGRWSPSPRVSGRSWGEWFPHLHATFGDMRLETAPKAIAIERLKPRPSEEEQGF